MSGTTAQEGSEAEVPEASFRSTDPAASCTTVTGDPVDLAIEDGSSTLAMGAYSDLGTSAFWAGDFAALDQILLMAQKLAGTGPWTDEEAALVVFEHSIAAVVASLRGQPEVAAASFVAALRPAGGPQVARARVLAHSLRAALASDGQPDRALADVEAARQLAASFDDPALLAIASIGEGFAKGELGLFAEAAVILHGAARDLPVGLRRSVAELRLAEVQLRMGDRAAARLTVDGAREVFLAAGARYWGARAALLTGAIDRDRGGRWLTLARELSLPDPAYDRLFLPDGALRINLDSLPVMQRDGVPVDFLTRHAEAALRLLALSGSKGMSPEELIEAFWPGVDHQRQRARLRTLLWQTRNSLGSDAWRLQRRRDLIVFDGSGVELVGSAKKASIIAGFARRRSSAL